MCETCLQTEPNLSTKQKVKLLSRVQVLLCVAHKHLYSPWSWQLHVCWRDEIILVHEADNCRNPKFCINWAQRELHIQENMSSSEHTSLSSTILIQVYAVKCERCTQKLHWLVAFVLRVALWYLKNKYCSLRNHILYLLFFISAQNILSHVNRRKEIKGAREQGVEGCIWT